MIISSSSSSSLFSSSSGLLYNKPSSKFQIPPQPSRIHARSYKDEATGAGGSSQIVDANLSVLRERIENVKIKEKLEQRCRRGNGWNYVAGYNEKLERDAQMLKVFELVRVVFGTLGFSLLSCTTLMCFVSLVVHTNQ